MMTEETVFSKLETLKKLDVTNVTELKVELEKLVDFSISSVKALNISL